MAKQATIDTPETPVTAATLPKMTTEDLLGIIAGMQQQLLESQKAQVAANQALAEAIIESKKPYVDPKKEINEKMFREQAKETELRQKANIRYAQNMCEHIAGCSPLSEQKDIAGRTSIIWHRTDVGADVGVCTVCQKIFRPGDPDYAVWRNKKSFNKLSASGVRMFADPLKAREDSYLKDS